MQTVFFIACKTSWSFSLFFPTVTEMRNPIIFYWNVDDSCFLQNDGRVFTLVFVPRMIRF